MGLGTNFSLGSITLPYLYNQDVGLLLPILLWIAAIAIMWHWDGDWYTFAMYFIWSFAIAVGLLLLIVPGLIILGYFLYRHGIVNIIAILLGPVGWAIGSILDWY